MALPATAAPLVLARNVFDVVHQFPNGTIDATSEAVGSEGWRVGNYRRDRDWWQPTSDGAPFSTFPQVDLGAGVTHNPDALFIDRGHNLWGQTIAVQAKLLPADPYNTHAGTWVVPANPGLGVGTGDPTTGIAVTEEGALWTMWDHGGMGAMRYFILYVQAVAGYFPRIPGIILGARHQLLSYSKTYDEDAGERAEDSTQSRFGMLAVDRTVSWRKIQLSLTHIGQAEYDSSIRSLRHLLFTRGVPAVVFKNYGISPYRGWMYRYTGKTWGMPAQTFYRSGQLTLREHDHLIDNGGS